MLLSGCTACEVRERDESITKEKCAKNLQAKEGRQEGEPGQCRKPSSRGAARRSTKALHCLKSSDASSFTRFGRLWGMHVKAKYQSCLLRTAGPTHPPCSLPELQRSCRSKKGRRRSFCAWHSSNPIPSDAHLMRLGVQAFVRRRAAVLFSTARKTVASERASG